MPRSSTTRTRDRPLPPRRPRPGRSGHAAGSCRRSSTWPLSPGARLGAAGQRIFERHGAALGLARLDSNVANILCRQDRFDEALALYEGAYEQLRVRGEPQDVAAVLSNMAVCHINLNDFEQALETYHAARTYCESHEMPALVVQADYNIAYLYYLRGEYSRALELYEATRRRCERLSDHYHAALCDLDQSELSLELNLTEDGARLGQLAYLRFAELGMNYEAAKALTWIAIAAAQQGRTARALVCFGRARRRFRRENNQAWLALIDLYEALVLLDTDQPSPAVPLASSALEVFARAGLPAKAAFSELVLARLALRAGDPVEAERRVLGLSSGSGRPGARAPVPGRVRARPGARGPRPATIWPPTPTSTRTCGSRTAQRPPGGAQDRVSQDKLVVYEAWWRLRWRATRG